MQTAKGMHGGEWAVKTRVVVNLSRELVALLPLPYTPLLPVLWFVAQPVPASWYLMLLAISLLNSFHRCPCMYRWVVCSCQQYAVALCLHGCYTLLPLPGTVK